MARPASWLRSLVSSLESVRSKRGRSVLGRRLHAESLESRVTPVASMSVVKVDAFAPGGDVNNDGIFQPGDTIRYTVTVANNGTVDLTGVTFTDIEDPNTTLGGVNVSPLAFDDMYTAVANTQLRVGTPGALSGPAAAVAGRVTDNDTEFLSDTFAISAFDANSVQGGTVVMETSGVNAGSFSYIPAAGFTGVDSFTYTIRDDGFDGIAGNADDLTSVGTVTITVGTQKVWYVDNSYAGANGTSDGRSHRPFTSLAAVTGATGPDAVGDIIYIREAGAAYDGGVALLNNQLLFGGSHALNVNGFALTTAGLPTNLTTMAAGTNAITLGSGNTLAGFAIGNTTGAKIAGTNFGTVSFSSIFMTGTGAALNLDTGEINTAAGIINSLASTSSVTAIRLNNVTGFLNASGGVGAGISGATGPAIEIIGGSVDMVYNPGITQANNAALLSVSGGHTGTLTFQSFAVSATNGTGLVFNNADGSYTFNVSTSLSGGAAISIANGSTGTFAFTNATITNPSSTAFSIVDSNANVTYNGGITKTSAGFLIDVDNHDAGTVTFQGTTLSSTGSSSGIRVQNNSGGTVNFNNSIKTLTTGANAAVTLSNNTGATVNFGGGGLDIDTSSGVGFNATGGGTINVTGTANTITSTSGTALNVTNTTIGASGLNFQSISSGSATSSTAAGIILDSTGNLGGLTVTGVGTTAGSGGTIRNKSGANITTGSSRDPNGTTAGTGVFLQDTQSISLANMQLNDFTNFAIFGDNVVGLSIAGTVINGVNGDDAGQSEGSVRFRNLTGSASITSSNISGALEHTFAVENSTGTLDRITIDGTTFGTHQAGSLGNALLIESLGTAVINCTITNNVFLSAPGTHINRVLNASTASDTIINGNNISNAGVAAVSGGGAAIRLFGGSNNATASTADDTNASATFNISNNTMRDSRGTAIGVSKLGGSGMFVGTIANNIIGLSALSNSGSSEGSGISVVNDGPAGGSFTVAITDNAIRQFNNFGINLQLGGSGIVGASTLNATVTGNTVTNPGTLVFPKNGIQLNAGTTSGDTYTVNLTLGGAGALSNTITGTGTDGGTDFRLRQRQATTVILPGYTGPARDDTDFDVAEVVAFVQANNDTVSVPSGSAASSSAMLGGYSNGPATPQPLLAAEGGVEASESGASGNTLVGNDPVAEVQPESSAPDAMLPHEPDGGPTSNLSVISSHPSTSLIPVVNGNTTQPNLDFLVDAAINRWTATGLTSHQLDLLRNITFEVADMPGWYLGSAVPGHITIDSDAAGYGWYIDPTPLDDSEFGHVLASTHLQADPWSASAGRMDLLTTVMHELGHQLGLPDYYSLDQRSNLMFGYLYQGERRLPAANQADGADANFLLEHATPAFQVGPISIGNLPIGKSVTIQFDTTINSSISASSVSNQGTADSNETAPVLSDDPSVAGAADPTVTPVDRPDVTVAVSTASVNENGGTNLVYTFTREGATTNALTVNVTLGGTATLGIDYTQTGITSGQITFLAGSSTAVVTVTPTGDLIVENNETVILTVAAGAGYDAPGDPSYAGTSIGTQTGTIANDDTATLTLTPVGITQNEGAGSTSINYVFTATLSHDVEGGFQVAHTTNDGTATVADGDYVDNDGTLTFTGNASETQMITVVVNGDNKVELDEAFTVALGAISATSAVQIAAITPSGSPQTGTITNDDSATVSLAANVSNPESTTPFAFTVTLSNSVDVAVTVLFSTADSTATAGSDFTGITNQLVTFAAGSTTGQLVNVTVSNESVVEADEVFDVSIGTLSASGRDVSLGTTTRTGTIQNDDTATLTLSGGGSVAEGQSGTSTRNFTVTLSDAVQGGFTVAYTVDDGSANAGTDYTDNDGTLTFAGTVGEIETIAVDILGDTDIEGDETFTVVLGAIGGTTATQIAAITPTGSPQTGTIANDDASISVAVAPASVAEDGTGTLVYTFTRTGFTAGPLTVIFNVGGTATQADSDYTQIGADTFTDTSGTVTFATGELTKTVTVSPTDDTNGEADETLTLTVVAATGYTPAAPSVATGTIANDDTAVSVAVAGSPATEGGAGTLVYTFTRSGSTATALTVNFTAGGTASFAGGDYSQSGAATFDGTNGTVVIPIGLSSVDVTLTPLNDALVEGDETAVLTVDTGADYGVGSPNPATGTIADSDTATVGFQTLSSTVGEDGGAVTLTVVLTTAPGNTLESAAVFDVSVLLGNGEAADFLLGTTQINFAAGSANGATQTVTITPQADTLVEGDETLTVRLAANSGAATVDASARDHALTITDADSASVSFQSASGSTGEAGGQALVAAVLTTTGGSTLENAGVFDISASLGTAEAGDFTLDTTQITFAAGSGNAAIQNVGVTPNNDTIVEGSETLTLSLAVASGVATVGGTPSHTLTLVDNDTATVRFAAGTSSAPEATSPHTVGVELLITANGTAGTGSLEQALSVVVSDAGTGSATAGGTDYTFAAPVTVTFAAGAVSSTQTVDVGIANDTLIEGSESIDLSLGSLTDPSAQSTLGTAAHAITLADNDTATVSFVVGSSAAAEGTATHTVSVQLQSSANGIPGAGTLASAVTVDVVDLGTGSATGGGTDYTFASPTQVTFAAGSGAGTQTVSLAIVDDSTVETPETVSLQLQNVAGSGATIGSTADHTVSITDTEVSVAVAPTSVAEDSGTGLAFTFTRTGVLTAGLTVSFTVGGSATFGTDYTVAGAASFTATSGTVAFAPGSATATVTLTPTADGLVEANEDATLTITDAVGYNVGTPATDTATITNDDAAPVVTAGQSFTVFENRPTGTAVGTVAATDDVGTVFQGWAIVGGNTGGAFAINPATGEISVANPAALDFETTPTFTLSVTVSDGSNTSLPVDVTIDLSDVNDAPTFAAANPPAALEDGGAQTVTGWATFDPTPETGQTAVAYTVTAVGNPSLFAVLPSIAADGTLTYTPAANAFGTSTIAVVVRDDGGTANGGSDTSLSQTFTITIAPVNDAPTFAVGPDATVSGPAPRTIPGAATAISAGPGESGQTLAFLVSASDPSLFAVQPGVAADGTLTFTPAAGKSGTAIITVTLRDDGGTANGGIDTSVSQTFSLTVTARPDQNQADRYAVSGGDSTTILNLAGPIGSPVNPFPGGSPSGVRSAIADVSGDGVPDLIAATGPGISTAVVVIDGATGERRSFVPFEASFLGGAFVASGDVDGDGFSDVAVSADSTGGPRVILYSGRTGEKMADFYGIDDPAFFGGARVALGDFDGDGLADLVVAAGTGGGPRVAIFDGATLRSGSTPTRLVADFFVFESTLRDGVYVAAGDVDGDGFADLIAGGGPGGGPRVFVTDGRDLLSSNGKILTPLTDFFAGSPTLRSGVRVAAKDLDGDPLADLVVSVPTETGALATVYLGRNLPQPEPNLSDLTEDSISGVYVG